MVSMALLFLYAVTRNTVRREEDLKSRLSINSLGSIPRIRQKKRSNEKAKSLLIDKKNQAAVLGESFRAVRTKILKETEKSKMQYLMITSAAASEGKTTFAMNMAIALASKGKKVILIDLDLRNPSVAPGMRRRKANQRKQKSRNMESMMYWKERLRWIRHFIPMAKTVYGFCRVSDRYQIQPDYWEVSR